MNHRPLVAITMGDPAGVGPEVIVSSWLSPECQEARRFIVGRASIIQRAIDTLRLDLRVRTIDQTADINGDAAEIPVLEISYSGADRVAFGKLSGAAGRAAYESIVATIKLALTGDIDAMVTAPVNKAAIAQAGYKTHGHTELLAELCGSNRVAMMLYLPESGMISRRPEQAAGIGLGVVHATLHTALRDVFSKLTVDRIVECCQLADSFATSMLRAQALKRRPKIGVAALNPHAGENGLFGCEEIDIIEPAIARARQMQIPALGPFACDALMFRAASGEFDCIVAMYHDQGHIALKLLAIHDAVNITLGLPIVRTSVAHGTAFDLAGLGRADCRSMIQATKAAIQLVRQRTS